MNNLLIIDDPQKDRGHTWKWVVGLSILVVTIFIILSATFYSVGQNNNIGNRSPSTDLDGLTTTSNFIQVICAFLLSGVIITAPLLSLSLHQTYDTLLSIWKQCLVLNLQDTRLRCEKSLKSFQENYKGINLFYYPLWSISVTLLFVLILLMTNIIPNSIFDYSSHTLLLLVSCFVSLSFALLALVSFFRIRPGESKLRLINVLVEEYNTKRGEIVPIDQVDTLDKQNKTSNKKRNNSWKPRIRKGK